MKTCQERLNSRQRSARVESDSVGQRTSGDDRFAIRDGGLRIWFGCAGGVLGALACFLDGYSARLPVVVYLAVVTPWLVRSDLQRFRLPNRLLLIGYVLLASGMATLAGTEWPQGLSITVWGTTLGAWLVLLPVAMSGVLGMGDVKLAALLSAVLAVDSIWSVVIALQTAAVLAAVVAVLTMGRNYLGRTGNLERPYQPSAGPYQPSVGPYLPSAGMATRIALGPPLLAGFWLALFCIRMPS